MSRALEVGNVIVDSGTLYIDAETTDIVVNHSLGGVPDFAYICVDLDDQDLVPYNSCVACAYGLVKPISDNSSKFKYSYCYKHATSGNILLGSYSLNSNQYSDTQFHFIRGNSNWKPTDTNGDPVPYKWVVGRFTDWRA